MRDELYIEDVRADLSDSSPIILNIAVNDLAELKDRQSAYSNTLKLPKTAHNAMIFGQAQIDAFTQEQPYKLLSCRLIQNGIEQISRGSISLKRVTDFFECQITYGLSGLADALKKNVYLSGEIKEIKDAKLADLNWDDIPNFERNIATIVASQTGQNPLWAVIDYGDTLNNTSIINTTYLRPGVLYSQILTRIQQYTGYRFFGGANYTAGFNDYIPFSDNDLIDYQGTIYYDTFLPLSVVKNVPDFTIKGVLKDYMQRYFLTPIVDNFKKTVYFRSFDELYANKPNAKDWTNKFVDNGRDDSFALGSYAQTNTLTWEEDATNYANGSFVVLNENLDTSMELVKSIFAGTANTTKLGTVDIASIRKFNTSPLPNYGYPYEIETKPRVVNIKQVNGIYNFDDGTTVTPVNGIKVGVSRTWDFYLDNYGQGLLRLLKKARVITRTAILSELDVKDFDFFTPVYDAREGKYYYVNGISSFQPNKIVKVNLVRL